MPATPVSLLKWWARFTPNRVAWSLVDGELTYSQAYNSVTNLLEELQSEKRFVKSRVAIAGSPIFCCKSASALLSLENLVTLMPNTSIGRRQIEALFESVHSEKTNIQSNVPASFETAALNKSSHISQNLSRTSGDFEALALFTSGSTGNPKLVALTYKNLISRFRQHTKTFSRRDRVISFFPMFSAVGFYSFLDSLRRGKTYVGSGSFEFTMEQIKKWKIDTIISSPAAVEDFLDLAQEAGVRLDSIKKIICTGGLLTDKLASRIKDYFACKVFIHYGSTEIGKVTVTDFDSRQTEADQGRVLRGVAVDIVDDEGNLLGVGHEGRVRIRTHHPSSYLSEDLGSRPVMDNGYFYPGDVGSITADRRLQIVGRRDLVANLSGVKVNLEDYEAFGRASLDLDCLAFPYADNGGVMRIGIAFTKENVDPVAISTSYAMRFRKQAPMIFIKVQAFPQTETGKPDRRALANLVQQSGGDNVAG